MPCSQLRRQWLRHRSEYLRFRSLSPKGRVVFLNHASGNIIRNVNQFRHLIYPGHEFGLKPRFTYGNQGIGLVPLPQITTTQARDFLASPERYLDHEHFLPGGHSGIQVISFPYLLTIAKALARHYHLRALLLDVPRYL
jgi:hypothetical protein